MTLCSRTRSRSVTSVAPEIDRGRARPGTDPYRSRSARGTVPDRRIARRRAPGRSGWSSRGRARCPCRTTTASPQMFENRNGLSSVTTVSSHNGPFRSRSRVHVVGADVARQADVTVDGGRAGRAADSGGASPRRTGRSRLRTRHRDRPATSARRPDSWCSMRSSAYSSVRWL